MTIAKFLADVAERMAAGANTYGNRSFTKPPSAIAVELRQELLDLVGWSYILWGQAARKLDGPEREDLRRRLFLQAIEHRMARGDRGDPHGPGHARGLPTCKQDLEVLCLDVYRFAVEFESRLLPIVQAIEVAQAIELQPRRRSSRHGRPDPRSSD